MSAYIRLITVKPLPKEQSKLWFLTVLKNLPTGMITQTTIVVDGKEKSTRFFEKKLGKHKVAYIVPLSRDLQPNEVYDLVKKWALEFPSGDFIIDYSQREVHYPTYSVNNIEQHKLEQVLDSWVKQEHKRWMQNALDHGWKYGTMMSTQKKTHPWLQPWEQLPQIAQQQKLSSIKDLIKALKTFGYKIVQDTVG